MSERRLIRCLTLSAVLCGAALSGFSGARAAGQGGHRSLEEVRVVVDATRRSQAMQGLGSTQRAWTDAHVAEVGVTPTIPQPIQDQILTQLYTELGLSRARIFGGHGFEDRIAYVQQAKKFGLTYLISATDPSRWVDPEQHASNTVALLLRWRAAGIEPQYQTLINEPAQRPWADGQWHRRAVRALGPRMRAAGLRTMLVIPDDLNSCAAHPIAGMVLEDAEARKYVGAFGYHMYGGNHLCLREMKDLSLRYGVPVWMTEYSWEPGFESSLAWAKQIHDLVVNYHVSAVDYMWGFFGDWDIQKSNKENLIQVTFGSDGRYRNHRRTSKYFVTGQFSRFIRPGDVRVDASTNASEVLVSAYSSSGKLIIVVINDRADQVSMNVNIKGLPLTRSFSAVRTSHVESWKTLAPVPWRGSGFETVLPGKSVTTFVSAGP